MPTLSPALPQTWRALVLVMQFGLFPSNLNALQIFFCRSDVSEMHPVRVEVALGLGRIVALHY
jgi:hypothetical protein